MARKKDASYRSYQYLEPGADSDADVGKIAGGNALRVLKETWAR